MPDRDWVLYFRLQDAARFEAVHGEAISRAARADLTRGLEEAARRALSRHRPLTGLQSPAFGSWGMPFRLLGQEIEADPGEQLAAVSAAAGALARDLLRGELGSAVAHYVRLDAGVLPLRPDAPAGAWAGALAALPDAAPPAADQDAEREAVARIIERRVDVHLQEIVSLADGRPVAYEALARGPEGTPLREPGLLLDAASRHGLRAELEHACLASALDIVPRLPGPARLAVNLSPDLFATPPARRLADVAGLGRRLILEVTEQLPIPEPERLAGELERHRRAGAKIALDDAGCGYLNMDLVRALRPDVVKLCLTVTRRVGRGAEVLASVRRTVAAVRAAGAEALAEGVETEEQAALMRECGATLAQGLFFSAPRPWAETLGGPS